MYNAKLHSFKIFIALLDIFLVRIVANLFLGFFHGESSLNFFPVNRGLTKTILIKATFIPSKRSWLISAMKEN